MSKFKSSFVVLLFACTMEVALAGCLGSEGRSQVQDKGAVAVIEYWSKWSDQTLWFGTSMPGNLFYPDDTASATIAAPPFPNGDDIQVDVKVYSAGNELVAEQDDVTLTQAANYHASINLPTKGLGFYRAVLTATDGTESKRAVKRYAVIPEQPTSLEAGSPFGVNTHLNPFRSRKPPAILGQIVKRAGIAWIRDGVQPANLDQDQAVYVAQDNNLCYLPVFCGIYMPIDKLKNANGDWDFTEVAAKHRAYAEKYGKLIDYYDIANEPMQKWSAAVGGSWWGGVWVRPFSHYAESVSKAIKSADPEAKVLWEDGDTLVWYPQLSQYAADDIDILSPHPYNTHPTLPLPEEQPVLEQYDELHQFVKEQNLSWRVWVGEIGYSSFLLPEGKQPTFYTPVTEQEQAALLVRAIVMHLFHGADKVFWYGLKDDGPDRSQPEQNFGLVTYDLQPKPAVVAYSNLISRLRNSSWLGSYKIGGFAKAYVFEDAQTKKITLVAWRQNGQRLEAIPAGSGITELTVTDIYGQPKDITVTDGKARIPLDTSPVYIEGLQPQDVNPYIGRKRSWAATPTLR